MFCDDCNLFGVPIPENTDTCGNCGNHNVFIYYAVVCPATLSDEEAGALLACIGLSVGVVGANPTNDLAFRVVERIRASRPARQR